jgi:hypothetical protein
MSQQTILRMKHIEGMEVTTLPESPAVTKRGESKSFPRQDEKYQVIFNK